MSDRLGRRLTPSQSLISYWRKGVEVGRRLAVKMCLSQAEFSERRASKILSVLGRVMGGARSSVALLQVNTVNSAVSK